MAFAAGDREAMEQLLAPGYAFYSPPDPGLTGRVISSDAGPTRNC